MGVKEAADELLAIAEEMEKDAAEVTEFVCNKCNHTATLASINGKRNDMAKTANVTASEVSVNDQVFCPACDGVMAYRETEASKAYYYDPDKKAAEEVKEEKPVAEGEEAVAPAAKTADYDE